MDPSPNAAKSREVRLGLVMYGGVSLAIYINGVAREFHDAVLGRGVYRLVKSLTDSDVVVDVISGTSAGGINGIFLGYALANRREFAACASLWRRDGDIRKLLRGPSSDPEIASVLDSEGYYHPALASAFRAMPDRTDAPDDDVSDLSELDLFVTGTDVDGRAYTAFDDAGHAIDVKDHRTVFLLKYRRGRKNDFDPRPDPDVAADALARLSRVTSCFPGAFAPVHVGMAEPGDATTDQKLQRWGMMGKEACFLDGGVLDNKPFTDTLRAMFFRLADRPVRRVLFYVEPDPEIHARTTVATRPNFVSAISSALIGIPGYESISADLRQLAEHNARVTQFNRIVDDAIAAAGTPPGASEQTIYRRARLAALSSRVVDAVFRTDGRAVRIDRPEEQRWAAELVQAFDTRVRGGSAGLEDEILARFDVTFRMRRALHVLEALDSRGPLGYLFTRQVKLYEILLWAIETLLDEAPLRWTPAGTERHAAACARRADELWNAVAGALEALLDPAGFEGALGALPRTFPVARLLESLRGPEPPRPDWWLTSAELSDVQRALRARVDAIKGAMPPPRGSTAPNLLDLADALEQQILAAPGAEAARAAWERFAAVDLRTFPFQALAGIHERQVVSTIRVSPRDASRGFSRQGLSDKVAGDAVYHFGGFFKRSWRSNDILWGRLDGLCQLVETLADRARVAALVRGPRRAVVAARFLEDAAPGRPPAFRRELDPAHLFPRSGPRTHERLGAWLRALLAGTPGEAETALGQATADAAGPGGAVPSFDEAIELLVEAAQLEVIREDLPGVVADAIEEQAEWNNWPTWRDEAPPSAAPEPEPSTWAFRPGSRKVDPFVAAMAAADRMRSIDAWASAEDAVARRPSETRLGRFFRESYRVGREKVLVDIPSTVLLEIVATALVVTRTCVVNAFGPERAKRVRRHPLYIALLGAPLRALHLVATLANRSTRAALAVTSAGLLGLLLAALSGLALWTGDTETSKAIFVPVLAAGGALLLAAALFLVMLVRLTKSRRS